MDVRRGLQRACSWHKTEVKKRQDDRVTRVDQRQARNPTTTPKKAIRIEPKGIDWDRDIILWQGTHRRAAPRCRWLHSHK